MATFWISDAKGRVLGPVTLEVLRDLAGAGRVTEVTQVSRDGHAWLPATQVPEVLALLKPSSAGGLEDLEIQKAARLREQLVTLKTRLPHEVFQVKSDATLDQHRTAFFALVKRFHPARLPPTAHPELRNACREAFEFLANLMAQVERTLPQTAASLRSMPVPATPLAGTSSTRPGMSRTAAFVAPPRVTYRLEDFVGFQHDGDIVAARVRITPVNAGIFTDHSIANLSSGGVFIPSERRLPLGTLLDLNFVFEDTSREVSARGKVIWENAGAAKKLVAGVGVRFLRIDAADTQFIRSFIQAIPEKERQVLRF